MKRGCLICLSVMVTALGAEEAALPLSREAPALYAEKLADRLVKLADAKGNLPKDLGAKTGGVILVNEMLHYLKDDGTRLLVEHRILQPVNQAGVEGAARYVTGCRRTGQKLHLMEARTITADGKSLPVQADAAFLRTSQSEGEEAMYDDYQELVVIFPDVKPGCQTEAVVVIETSEPRIPGHFTAQEPFGYYWPSRQTRVMMDMPQSVAPTLKMSVLGSGVPEQQRQEKDGRVVLTWDRRDLPELHPENARQPITQLGPCLFLTTLQSWEEFLAWYAPQVMKAAELPDSLQEMITQTTASATTLRGTLDPLLAKVSQEVRYVGLEFGYCDLVPHAPAEVWKNQYGDCKDKANLLRAMLRTKGITSYLALVNTEHIGRVEKRNPDYRDFTHVILAVEEAPGKYLFCDPTVPGLTAGLLGPGSVNREVLLVKPDAPAEWVTTPSLSLGTVRYDFAATVDSSGGWAGWLTFGASDYFAATYRRLEAESSHEQRLRRLANLLAGFTEGGRIIDLKLTTEQAERDYRTEGYFVIPGTGSSVRFPSDRSLMPDLGDGKDRTTAYPLWQGGTEVTAKLKLPPGWHPEKLPKPATLSNAYAEGAAAWRFAEGVLHAELHWKIKRTPLPAADVEGFARDLQVFKSWLEKPLNLTADEPSPPTGPAPKADPLADFERMPTGEGQLALVDEKYPATGNVTLRRAALRKTRQYFSDDKTTVFQVGISLANLDLEAGKNEVALEALETLLSTMKDAVDADHYAAGEYYQAVAHTRLDQVEEALAIWNRLAADPTLNEARRGFSRYRLALHLADQKPEVALTHIREGLKLHSGAEPALYDQLALLQLRQQHADDFQKELQALVAQRPDHLAYTLETLAQRVTTLPSEDAEIATTLLGMLRGLGDPQQVSQAFADLLSTASGLRETTALTQQAQDRLRAFANEHPEALPSVEVPAGLDTAAKLSAAAEGFTEKPIQVDKAVRYAFAGLLCGPPDPTFPERLWRSAAFTEHWWRTVATKEPADNPAQLLLGTLLDTLESFPPLAHPRLDATLLRAQWLGNQHQPEAALEVLDKMLALPDLPKIFFCAGKYRYGKFQEELHHPDVARTTYRELEPQVAQSPRAISGVHRGILLNLWHGDFDAALQGCECLRKLTDQQISSSECPKDLFHLLEFTKDPATAQRFWQASAAWWPQWLAISKVLHKQAPPEQAFVPFINNAEEFGQRLGLAKQAARPEEVATLLDEIAAAGRWLPLYLVEFQGLLITLERLSDQAPRRKCRSLAVELQPIVPASLIMESRKALLMVTAVAFDDGDFSKIPKLMTSFRTFSSELDVVSLAMSKLYALASCRLKTEQTVALRELEAAILSDVYDERPEMTANALLQLYDALGPQVLKSEVLSRMASYPAVKAQPKLAAELARKQKLTSTAEFPAQIAKALQAWLHEAPPDWWALSAPEIISGLSPEALKDLLESPSLEIRFKTSVLLLLDPTQPEKRQQAALESFFMATILMLSSEQTATNYVRHFLAHPALANPPEYSPLPILLVNAALRYPAHWEKWQKLPCLSTLRERFPDFLTAIDDFFAKNPHDPAQQQKLCTACPNSDGGRVVGRFLVDQFVMFGHLNVLKTMQRQAQRDPSHPCAALVGDALKTVETFLPLRTALRPLCLELLSAAPAETDSARQFYTLSEIARLSEPEAARILLWQARQELTPISEPFWHLLLVAHRDRLSLPQRVRLLEAYLTAVPASAAAQKFALINELLDIDEPSERQSAREILHDSAASRARYDYLIALRSTETPDVRHLLQSADSAAGQQFLAFYATATWLAREDTDGLKWVSEAFPGLINALPLHLQVRYAKILSQPQDLPRLTQETRQLLAGAIAQGSLEQIESALQAVQELSLPDLLTPVILTNLKATIPPDHRCRIHLALLQKDWSQALTTATTVLKTHPTLYALYWLKAQALVGLDRKPEAHQALEIYLKYSANEPDHAPALRLAKTLLPEPPPR